MIAPPPVFTRLAVDSMGGQYRIVAGGLEEYLAKYGEAGWLRGLSDERPLTGIQTTSGPDGNRASEGIRVKDIFVDYYIRTHPEQDQFRWKPNAGWAERDSLAEGIAGHIVLARLTPAPPQPAAIGMALGLWNTGELYDGGFKVTDEQLARSFSGIGPGQMRVVQVHVFEQSRVSVKLLSDAIHRIEGLIPSNQRASVRVEVTGDNGLMWISVPDWRQ
jgi:hypothetical protein